MNLHAALDDRSIGQPRWSLVAAHCSRTRLGQVIQHIALLLAQRGGPYHGGQGQRRQAQGRLGVGHGLPPVPLDGLIGDAGGGRAASRARPTATAAVLCISRQICRRAHLVSMAVKG